MPILLAFLYITAASDWTVYHSVVRLTSQEPKEILVAQHCANSSRFLFPERLCFPVCGSHLLIVRSLRAPKAKDCALSYDV